MFSHLLSSVTTTPNLLLFLPLLFLTLTPQIHATNSTTLNCTASYPNQPNTPYPNQYQICQTFLPLTSKTHPFDFFTKVAEDVHWTIEGSHPLAGSYTNRTVLIATFSRIDETGSAANPLGVSLVNIIGGGVEMWSVQELHVQGICRNGLIFDNRYAWVTRWNTTGYIVEARAYLDSALVAAAIIGNEVADFKYSDVRGVVVPSVTLSQEVLDGATGLDKTCD